MLVAGLSHQGLERPRNEDSFLIRREGEYTLMAVADGMGGHQAGDVASARAIAVLDDHWSALVRQGFPADNSRLEEIVQNIMQEANRVILEDSTRDSTKYGMGTTLTMGLLAGCHLIIGHVGDSRSYLIAGQTISLLTEDHSLVEELVRQGDVSPEEAQDHPQRHILTRALGTNRALQVDLVERLLPPGSMLLLCTDGLTTLVQDHEILNIVLTEETPDQAVEALIDLANARGGFDNITVVLAAEIGR
ncbi:MAG: Stp1/IreP family PP2C-type Ser/Thr phosphatase [Firmicutes bacterium]|jgi:serine/threonine protein phosphatase PrpC|nr:Stp1/IreP family PP2C-type Ser/Thr phosphatase [Bacillota bacterium]